MTARKPPIYASCNRCGYRGVEREHVCREDRLVAPAEPAPRLGPAARVNAPLGPGEGTDGLDVMRMVGEYATLVGRPIGVIETNRPGVLHIVQRCRVCRGEVPGEVRGFTNPSELALRLAYAIRRSYLLHECPPVASSLTGLAPDELDHLHQSLERDLTRLAERLAELDRLRS